MYTVELVAAVAISAGLIMPGFLSGGRTGPSGFGCGRRIRNAATAATTTNKAPPPMIRLRRDSLFVWWIIRSTVARPTWPPGAAVGGGMLIAAPADIGAPIGAVAEPPTRVGGIGVCAKVGALVSPPILVGRIVLAGRGSRSNWNSGPPAPN